MTTVHKSQRAGIKKLYPLRNQLINPSIHSQTINKTSDFKVFHFTTSPWPILAPDFPRNQASHKLKAILTTDLVSPQSKSLSCVPATSPYQTNHCNNTKTYAHTLLCILYKHLPWPLCRRAGIKKLYSLRDQLINQSINPSTKSTNQQDLRLQSTSPQSPWHSR